MEQRDVRDPRDVELNAAKRRRDVALAWFMTHPNDNRAATALWRASNECVSVAANMLNKAEENFQRASDDLEESEAELAAELQQQASEQ